MAVAFGCFFLALHFFDNPRIEGPACYNVGVDVLGTFICAALYYGCMEQTDEANHSFISLILLTSISFFLNGWMWFVTGVSEWRYLYLLFAVLYTWLDVCAVYCYYLYIRRTLSFEGRIAQFGDRWFFILLIASMLFTLVNLFIPLHFSVDTEGVFHKTSMYWQTDLYLIITASIITFMIFRCSATMRQKMVAMSMAYIPIAHYIITGGAFGYATQYGSVLLSLVMIYAILFNDRSRKLAETQTELAMATEIQESMLPSIFPAYPDRKEFDLYASMNPAREVGGDFYDYFLIDEDHLGLVIADVSGKGVPAALFMMISKTIIQNCAMLGYGAAEILTKTNEALCTENKMEMFVTAWVGILEISTGKILCANAGHEYPVIYRGSEFELLKDRHGFVLGGMEGSKYKEYEIQLKKGDRLFLYTDGVPEAMNASGEMFGIDRMMSVLKALNAGVTPKEILSEVKTAVDAFDDNAVQFDDLTMLCLEYKKEAALT